MHEHASEPLVDPDADEELYDVYLFINGGPSVTIPATSIENAEDKAVRLVQVALDHVTPNDVHLTVERDFAEEAFNDDAKLTLPPWVHRYVTNVENDMTG